MAFPLSFIKQYPERQRRRASRVLLIFPSIRHEYGHHANR